MLLVSGCGKDVTEHPPDIYIKPDVDPVTVQLVFPGLRAEATAASADSIPAIRETQLTDSFTVAFWDGNGQVFVPGPDDRVEISVGAGFRCGLGGGTRRGLGLRTARSLRCSSRGPGVGSFWDASPLRGRGLLDRGAGSADSRRPRRG